jgi:hypothetical protein
MVHRLYSYITNGWNDAGIWWVGKDLEEDDRHFQSTVFQKELVRKYKYNSILCWY